MPPAAWAALDAAVARQRQAQRRAAEGAELRSGGRVSPPIAPPAARLRGLRAVAAEQDRSQASGAASARGPGKRRTGAGWRIACIGPARSGSAWHRHSQAAQPGNSGPLPRSARRLRRRLIAQQLARPARAKAACRAQVDEVAGRADRVQSGRTRHRHFGRAAHMAGGDARRGRAGV